MIQRLETSTVRYPYSFVIVGDSGAWPDPTAEAIYTQLLSQVAAMTDPAPVFFANLGDFAGPGTKERHERYLRAVEILPMPNICLIGNHDLDDASGRAAFEEVHGPVNFSFAYGHTRFVALHAAPGVAGEVAIGGTAAPEGVEGPRAEDIDFLEQALTEATEPHRVVLMHMPPHLDGHYAPHADWGFKKGEREFLDLIRTHNVQLVCCAHGLAFDTVVKNRIRFVMSGGGGTGLCSHFRGICRQGPGYPEDRGALFHVVVITIAEDGGISLQVVQAFGGLRVI